MVDQCTETIGTYYANSPKLKKFVDTLPGLMPGNHGHFAGGQKDEYIPIAVADTSTYPGSKYFIIGVVEHAQWMHSELQKATTLRSYVQLYPRLGTGWGQWPDDGTGKPVKATDGLTGQALPNPVPLYYLNAAGTGPDTTKPITWPGSNEQVYGYDKPHYLGPIILTFTGTPVRTQMVNLLPTGRATTDNAGSVLARNGDMFLPVDESLGGAGIAINGDKYPQNRAAFHLHGGDSPWISDGTPHQWIVPAADLSPYKAGSRVMNVPDMPFPGTGSINLFWPNDQSSRLMWYHDHTFGLTRQNAYGGEAAGYVIIDGAELAMQGGLDGKTTSTSFNNTTINKVLPNALLDQIVLIVQDKGFVPNDIAIQDSKWDTKAWGQPGDLWYPHVYEPFQLWGTAPDDTLTIDAVNHPTNPQPKNNPAGRWDYAVNDGSLMYLPPTVPLRTDPEYGDVAFPDGSYADGTPGKGPSATPESYMDTSMVNGVAYPTMTVEPKAYRVRFLNGANDRYYNLSLFVADGNVTSTDGRSNTEVKMVPERLPSVITVTKGGKGYTNPQVRIVDKITLADGTIIDGAGTGASATATVDSNTSAITAITLDQDTSGNTISGSGYVNPQVVITEAGRVPGPDDAIASVTTTFFVRPEGVPDPTTMGPSIVQFANEAGFLPVPVVHKPGPMLLNAFGEETTGEYFYLGNAERADTVIDFSQFAGKTLILYNDSTAPVPGGDTRYDYYTGNPDQTTTGGAPSTDIGFGPNTRTVMQFVVSNVKPAIDYPVTSTGAYDNAALKAELTKAYTAAADTHVVGAAAGAADPNLGALPLSVDTTNSRLTLADNSVVDMQIKTIHGFTDPNIGRLIAQLGTELPGAIGSPTPLGYIDSATDIIQAGDTQYWWIKNYDVDNHPMHFHLFNVQVLAHRNIGTGALRPPEQDEMGWKETVKNWPGEDVIVALRPKTPQLPFGLPKSVRTMDPTLKAGADVNDVLYGTALKTPQTNNYTGFSGKPVITTVPFAFSQIDLNPFVRDGSGNFVLDTNGKLTPNGNYGKGALDALGNARTVTNASQDFGWEYVWHCHILGHEENDLMRPMVFIPVVTKSATAPTAVTVSATGNVTWTDPTPALDSTGGANAATKGNAENEIGFRVERTVVTTNATSTNTNGTPTAGIFAPLAPTAPVVDTRVNTLANAISFQDAPAPFTDYQYQVVTVNEAGEMVSSPATLAQAPATPTGVSVDATGMVTWTDASSNETGFRVEKTQVSTSSGAAVAGSFGLVANLGANATSFKDVPLANTDYQYRVIAVNAAATPADSAASALFSLSTLPAPASISGVDATGVVTWIDYASNETGYFIERATVTTNTTGVQTTGAWTKISPATNLVANTQTYADPTFAQNTDYQYRVTAVNAKGNTVGPVFTYSATVPAAVGSVSIATGGVVGWLFSSTSSVTNYQVNRAAITGGVVGTFNTLTTVGGTVNTYTDTTVAPNTDYQYQVVAMKSTTPSTGNPVATLAQAPLAATGLTASLVTATGLTLTWVDGSTNEDGFSVESSIDGGATWVALAAKPLALNTTSYAVTALTPGSYYTFRVAATKNLAGYAPTYTTTPVVYTPATLVAPVVTALSSLVNGLPQALVTWTSTSVGQTGFTVERCAGTTVTCAATTANWTLLSTLPGAGAALSYLDTTLAPGATYVYRVKTLATNTSVVPNVTASVQGLSAQTSTAVAVAAPTNLSATSPTGVGVTLAWTDNSTNETSFQVFRTPAFAAAVNVTRTTTLKAATGGAVSYVDATAVAGTPYAYYVVAVNTTGTTVSASQASNTANITLAMPAPTGLTAAQSGANIVLTWTDTSASETAFEVLRTDSSKVTSTFTVARTTAQATSVNTAVTYSDVTALPGMVYTYAVRAVNTTVAIAPAPATTTYSGYTANVTASVVLPAPTNLSTAVPATGTGIILNWVDNATFETGYRIDRAVVTLDALGNVPAGTVYATLATQARTGNVVTSTGAAAYTDLTATALPVATPQPVYAYQVYAVKTTTVPAATVGGAATTVTSVSAPSNEAHTAAAAVVTGAPTGLTAVTSSGTSIVLSWIDNSTNETSFLVSRTDPNGVTVTFATPARTATLKTAVGGSVSYTDATAVVGTLYTYSVAAVTSTAAVLAVVTGPSSKSVQASLTLTAPSNATAAQTATGITIGWTDNSNNEIGFQIVRTGIDAAGLAIPIATFNVTSTTAQKTAIGTARTYIDTTAVPGVTYTYTVAATSGTAALPIAGTAISTTPVTITETIAAPSTPNAVITSATRITVTWTDLSTNETGFLVERLLTPTVAGTTPPAWTTLATVARTGTATTGINTAVSYIDNLVAPATQGTYQYRVSAVNMTGTVLNKASTAVASNTLDFNVPAQPTLLTVTPGAVGSGAVTLGWVDNASNETGYTIQRATNATFTTGLVTTAVPGAITVSPASYVLSGMTKGTKYFFRVAATNAAGTSAYVASTLAVTVP
jgi:FtsP/CotA-like multicopper oxidase with cupredoxin domain